MQRRYITDRIVFHRPRLRRQSARGGAGCRRAVDRADAGDRARIQLCPRRPSCCRRAKPGMMREVRIFTVRSEIPFAGHPNVGTAFVLAAQAATPPARLLFEEKAGLVPVEILIAGRQGGRCRTHCAAAAQAAHASSAPRRRRPAFRSRPPEIATGRPSAADRLGRAAVSRGGSDLARCVAARDAGCRGVRAAYSRAMAATRFISIRATCLARRSPASCRRGCFIRDRAAFPKIPPPAAPRPPPQLCLLNYPLSPTPSRRLRDRAGFRSGAAEPVADARPQAGRCSRLRACRRPLRADDGRHVLARGRGVRCRRLRTNRSHVCGATRFSTLTPSRSSMISAIHCRWQCGVIALVAEDADRAGFLHQRRQLVEFLFCLRRLQMRGIDLVQHRRICRCARPRGRSFGVPSPRRCR